MKDIGLLDISIYDVKLFLLLAEHLNFTKVATLASVAQPTLSKRISQLEHNLGVQLFNRDKRPIEMTEEAKVLSVAWAELYDKFEKAVNDVRMINKEESTVINIAAVESGNELLSLVGASVLVQKQYPQMEINQQYLSFREWRSALLSGDIDVMFTTLLESQNLDSTLTWKLIVPFTKEVCMLVTNPLTIKKSICFEDLQNQSFVSLSPIESIEYYQYLRDLCHKHGFEPNIVRYASSASNFLSSIYRNDEVVICDVLIRDIRSENIHRFPLQGVESGLIAVWKKDHHKEHLLDIIEIISKHFKKQIEENLHYN